MGFHPYKQNRRSQTGGKATFSINQPQADTNALTISTASKTTLPHRACSRDVNGPMDWEEEEPERAVTRWKMNVKLYKQNKMGQTLNTIAYLSLPEGVASVVGLTAMMTDHYFLLGESDNERESIEGVRTPRKPQKHACKGKISDCGRKRIRTYPRFFTIPSNGIKPHAVKKRTPRVPVAYSSDKDNSRKYVSPARLGLKPGADTKNDDVAHEMALALTEVSHRGDSPLVSWKSKRKAKGTPPTVTNQAGSGTEEGEKQGIIKGKLETKVAKSARSFYKEQRNKSKKALVAEDESSPFDALQTLADLSLMMPKTAYTGNTLYICIANESKTKRSRSIPGVEHTALKTSKPGKLKEGGHQSNTGLQRRKQLLPFKVSINVMVVPCNDHATVEVNKSMNKRKQPSHYITHPRQGKLANPPRNAFSSAELDMQKSSMEKDRKSTGGIVDEQPDKLEKLSNCLSRYQVQRWCAFEWFYSAIDYPWLATREFVEYLNHVGLGHVPRLTRVEWGVIRSSLGRPRRFSEQFLKEEKEKLNQYRESVRTHYAELNAGTREELPTDLARPLSVEQHVIAFHPRTREIHNGIVLTVDHCRCQYIDCMPLNPVENLPASFTKHNVNVNKYIENLKELKINEHLKEGKTEGYKNNYMLLSKVETLWLGEGGPGETATAEGANSQPSIPAQIQAKEADIRAIFELTRRLDKKDAMVSELRRMNDEVLDNQNGDNFIRDSESFKKEYAAVLLQLESRAVSLAKPVENLRDPGGNSSSSGYSCHAQESAGHVCDIVESSRAKALNVHCYSDNINLMIQTCTARQFPPAEVAQVLDEAVTSLQPFCPQNPSVYGEIHKCMGIVRNQTLALVPTWFPLDTLNVGAVRILWSEDSEYPPITSVHRTSCG
ncbi:unnamed protein product [Malus baccata var. baccata]